MDEFELLGRARPVEPPSAATVATARNALLHLTQAPEGAVSRRAPRLHRRVLVPVAAGVLAILSVALAAMPQGNPAPPPATSGPVGDPADDPAGDPAGDSTARTLLLAAAEKALTEPAPGKAAYWVSTRVQGVLIEVGEPGNRYAVMGRTTQTWWHSMTAGKDGVVVTQWSGAAPASDADRAAWAKAGSPSSWPMDQPPGCPPDPSQTWTMTSGTPTGVRIGDRQFTILGEPVSADQIRRLPTDTAALRGWLLKIIRKQGLAKDGEAAVAKMLFAGLTNLLFTTPVPPAVRAAAYRVLAQVPGVRSLGPTTDPEGRKGVAISIDTNDVAEEQRADSGGPTEVRLLFDPATGRTLSTQTRAVRPADYRSWVPAGAVVDYDALTGERWTDDRPPALDYRPEGNVQTSCGGEERPTRRK
jgi:hypothetical protein